MTGRRLAAAATLLLGVVVPANAQTPGSPPEAHAILFLPKGVQAPEGYERRIHDAADYAERFFVGWMKHWNHPAERERFFARDENGRVRVHVVEGEVGPRDESYAMTMLPTVWKTAHGRDGLPENRPVWWVWVYEGPPPVRYQNWRGSGNVSRGGWAKVNFDSSPGRIDTKGLLAGGFNEEFKLKGCIHELGHALGLPHLGPRARDNLGNSLMGPVTPAYWKRTKLREQRVHLSEASAAMLRRHWAFSGSTAYRHSLAKTEVQNVRVETDVRRGRVVLTGRLQATGRAHSAVVVDECGPDQTAYWRKAYVGKVEQNGDFEVTLTEPTGRDGTLKLVFCFRNGLVTGDGKTRGVDSVAATPYSFRAGRMVLGRPAD